LFVVADDAKSKRRAATRIAGATDLMDSDDYAADTSGIDLAARATSALFTMPSE
jgi:hypothetical protein